MFGTSRRLGIVPFEEPPNPRCGCRRSGDNSGMLEANGGTLAIDATPVTKELLATADSTLTLNGTSRTEIVTNINTIEVDLGSTLNLETAAISGGTVNVDGLLDSTGTSFICTRLPVCER